MANEKLEKLLEDVVRQQHAGWLNKVGWDAALDAALGEK